MKYSESRDADKIVQIVQSMRDMPGPLLPVLHEVQNQLGYVPDEVVPIIARELNLSRADVHGVISFYHHFASQPRGRHIVEVCRAESCQAVGGRSLEAFAKAKLGLDWYETSKDGQFTLEPVYCLGNCACSPAVRVGKQIFGRVSQQQFDELVEQLGNVPVEMA